MVAGALPSESPPPAVRVRRCAGRLRALEGKRGRCCCGAWARPYYYTAVPWAWPPQNAAEPPDQPRKHGAAHPGAAPRDPEVLQRGEASAPKGCSAPPRGWHTKPPGKGLDLGLCSAPRGLGQPGFPRQGRVASPEHPWQGGALPVPSPSPSHPTSWGVVRMLQRLGELRGMRGFSGGVPECWMWLCDGPKDPWWAARGHQQERWRGAGRFAHPRGWQGCGGQLSMVPALPAAPEPRDFWGCSCCKGKKSKWARRFVFPFKMRVGCECQTRSPNNRHELWKTLLKLPGLASHSPGLLPGLSA